VNLDVLKPHAPSIVELADRLCRLDRVSQVNITVIEMDANTETLKAEIIGNGFEFQLIKTEIEAVGATIHSIDHVSASRSVPAEGDPREGQG
jgi:hypothetical protein